MRHAGRSTVLSPEEAYQKLTSNVLERYLKRSTAQILNRSGLAAKFKSEPDQVIAGIHAGLPTVKPTDRLFALAELSFLHASKSGDTSYFLSAAIYAYAYLFPGDASATPDPSTPVSASPWSSIMRASPGASGRRTAKTW